MAWFMMFSSSLLVIMITGTLGCAIFICCKASRPLMPGMFSSRMIKSKFCDCSKSSASRPLVTVVTS